MSVDNPNHQNKINKLGRIISCERSVILYRISWDQNALLYTTQKVINGYSLDNYRLISPFKHSYPQLIARSLSAFE